ncbi:FtsW/RodA/SpoVE family cell cycle protein [Nautilia sp. PV-1]|uniref:FtsW/RodA/SpoVE family cell cycle protein n=1 Tax=Nautilia sp. PV-1 TaxID=2579250 RepID=UPI001FEF9F95|nr:FtsW/RodA/SpoVE family cell cycle protein [Nautilia sp. PV-1]
MDSLIFIIVGILMLIGALFSYSLPVYLEHAKHLSEYHFVVRYIGFGILGFGIMVLFAKLDPDKWFEKIGWFILITSAILVIAMPFLPESVAPIINGAKRWIKIGPFKFAPVEFFKLGVIFFLSWSFTRKVKKEAIPSLKEEFKLILPYFIILGGFWYLILAYQSDLGQVMVMGLLFAFMLLIAGGRFQTFTLILAGGIFVFIAAVLSSGYRYARFKAWLHLMTNNFFPNVTVESKMSYGQVEQSLNAIYHGGIIGQGIGNGIFKLGFLSDVHTDFVLAGIAEETGIIGISVIVILMLALVYRIYKIANRNEKKEYQLFAFGVGTLIMIQFIFNGLGVTSLIPIKGLTVPFLSYGGSSLVALCTAIGMVLMISKKAKLN